MQDGYSVDIQNIKDKLKGFKKKILSKRFIKNLFFHQTKKKKLSNIQYLYNKKKKRK
jgi:hypothetical protein